MTTSRRSRTLLAVVASLVMVATLGVAAPALAGPEPGQPQQDAPPQGRYVPLATPQLLHDDPVPAGQTVAVQVAGAGAIPLGAAAVAAHVTVKQPAADGSIRAWADGTPMPTASTVLFHAGTEATSSQALIQLGNLGGARLFNNSAGPVSLLVQAHGYYLHSADPDGSRFVPIPPSRIVDTRVASGPTSGAPVPGDGELIFPVGGHGGLPAGPEIAAVSLNVTVVDPATPGSWWLYPAGASPSTDHGHFHAGPNRTGSATVPLSPDGELSLHHHTDTAAHYVVDVNGYYPVPSSPVETTRVIPLAPERILDTAAGLGAPAGKRPAGSTLTLQVGGQAGVPDDGVSAVALMLSAYGGESTRGVLVTHAAGSPRPAVSDLQYTVADGVTNLVWARVSGDGAIDIYNSSVTHLWADVVAYAATATSPDPPTQVVAEAADQAATISWQAPAWDGGANVVDYTVTAEPGGASVTANDTTATVTGLDNGTAYTFQVTARNAAGSSEASAPSPAVVPHDPVPPGEVFVDEVYPRHEAAQVFWTAPTTGAESVTGYTITAEPGGATASAGPDDREAIVAGLDNGTTYRLTVTAHNANGPGEPSDPSPPVRPEPADVPAEPAGAIAFGMDQAIDVQWSPPLDGGAPITGYTVRAEPGGHELSTDPGTTVVTLPGLDNGTSYTLEVVATNLAGDSEPVRFEEVMPEASRAPDPVTSVQTSTTGDGVVTVSWEPPADFGTSPITSYAVTTEPPSGETTSTAPEATVSGLNPATEYTFAVTAHNDSGAGEPSEPTSPIRPAVGLVREPVVLTAASRASLTSVRTDGALIFHNATDQVAALEPGDIVVSEPADAARYGLLREVTGVRPAADGMLTVNTRDADLRDVFDEAAFSVESELTNHGDLADGLDLPGAVLSEPLVDGKTATEHDQAGVAPAQVAFRPAKIVVKILDLKAGNPPFQGKINGTLTLEGKAVFDASISSSGIQTSSRVEQSTTLELKYDVGVSGKLLEQTRQLFHREIFNKTILVAGVPVLVTANVIVEGKLAIDASVSLTGGVKYTHTVAAGHSSQDDDASIGDGEESGGEPSVDLVTLGGKAQAAVSLPLKFEVWLYKAAAVGLSVTPGLALSVSPVADPWWTLTFSLTVSMYARTAELLGNFSVERELFSLQWVLAESDEPFQGIAVTPSFAETTEGTPVEFDYDIVGYPEPDEHVWSLGSGSVGSIDDEGAFVSDEVGSAVVELTIPAGDGRPELTASAGVVVGDGPPQAPEAAEAVGGVLSAHARWEPPSEGPTPVRYVVHAVPVNGGFERVAGVSHPGTESHVLGLTGGEEYHITVRARNHAGASPPVTAGTVLVRSSLTDTGVPANLATDAFGNPDSTESAGKNGMTMSGDGRYVFYSILARSNVAPPELQELPNFTYLVRTDLATGETIVVSRDLDGVTPARIGTWSGTDQRSRISASRDGSVVAYPAMVGGNLDTEIWVHNIDEQETWNASEEIPAEHRSRKPMLAADGQTVAFLELSPSDQSNFLDNHVWRKTRGEPAQRITECPPPLTECRFDTPTGVFGGGFSVDASADLNRIVYTVAALNPAHPPTRGPKAVPVLWDSGTYTNLMAGADEFEYANRVSISGDGWVVAITYVNYYADIDLRGLASKRVGTGPIGVGDVFLPYEDGESRTPRDLNYDGRLLLYSVGTIGIGQGHMVQPADPAPAPISASGFHPWFAVSDNGNLLAWYQECDQSRVCTPDSPHGVWVLPVS